MDLLSGSSLTLSFLPTYRDTPLSSCPRPCQVKIRHLWLMSWSGSGLWNLTIMFKRTLVSKFPRYRCLCFFPIFLIILHYSYWKALLSLFNSQLETRVPLLFPSPHFSWFFGFGLDFLSNRWLLQRHLVHFRAQSSISRNRSPKKH